ncbi:hypothetical protein OSB04_017623 [Centaurea solstitialis]|uniref:Uncharacterized protein n=1 Tax=Centaurea solstitialis TaxID=347529 RepID=A0AA38TAS8_9ASTR|nr:hypothetical protein OSB04_017623 [Centaurea solstitialis]
MLRKMLVNGDVGETAEEMHIMLSCLCGFLSRFKGINPFFTQRIKSKFVFAGPSKNVETIFKYIAPELVPFQYDALSREGEQKFTSMDSVTEWIIKPATNHTIKFSAPESLLKGEEKEEDGRRSQHLAAAGAQASQKVYWIGNNEIDVSKFLLVVQKLREVNIYGPRQNVIRAILNDQSVICELVTGECTYDGKSRFQHTVSTFNNIPELGMYMTKLFFFNQRRQRRKSTNQYLVLRYGTKNPRALAYATSQR